MFRFLLYPLSLIYGSIVFLRNLFFDLQILKTHYFNIPVISVGNITVGGTGKTPHVEFLVQLLRQDNKIAVLSRGYKRKTKGFILATQNPTSNAIGDEPAQIKFKFPEIEVAVNASRVEGIKILEARNNDLVILDDAYQHRYVKPGLSILLIDFNRRLDKSHLLPYGDLRENASEMRRADIIIISKSPEKLKPIERRVIYEQVKPKPYQNLYFTYFKYGLLTAVYKNEQGISEDFRNHHELYSVLAITGLASSEPFVEYLKTFTSDIIHLEFPDHSSYNENRLKKILQTFNEIKNDRKIIITTEKDSTKLREKIEVDNILKDKMYFIPVEVSFMDNEIEFKNQIIDYVRKNKRNN